MRLANMLDPPYERKGSGTPVIGARPTAIPIFSKIWKPNQAIIPIQTNRPKMSFDLLAITSALHKTIE
jgi:hypothetical protein